MHQHLIFYDGSCGLCDHTVQFLLRYDKNALFDFAPLQGETARTLLKNIPQEDSLVLIEDYRSNQPKYSQLGRGALRVAWLLGGAWRLIGILHFLPHCLTDGAYRLVARNRHRFFSHDQCQLPDPKYKSRFLS